MPGACGGRSRIRRPCRSAGRIGSGCTLTVRWRRRPPAESAPSARARSLAARQQRGGGRLRAGCAWLVLVRVRRPHGDGRRGRVARGGGGRRGRGRGRAQVAPAAGGTPRGRAGARRGWWGPLGSVDRVLKGDAAVHLAVVELLDAVGDLPLAADRERVNLGELAGDLAVTVNHGDPFRRC